MSADKLLAKDLSRELEAAILGDFVALKAGSEDAQHFAQAFGSAAGQEWWKEAAPKRSLGIAAKAVSLERRGEFDSALSLYAAMAEVGGWVGFLGLLLQGWSSVVSEPAPIHGAADYVRALRRSPRKARLLAKLSTFAANKGDTKAARTLWLEGIDASDERTHLGRALRFEAMNLGFGPPDFETLNAPIREPEDELVHPGWIDQLRLKGADAALVQPLEDQFGGPWRFTMRMGITPLDDLSSAEAQAHWIGIPWVRRSVQKQLGAQLLAGAAGESAQWAQGVLLWTLGSGSNPQLALRYAEPHFDDESGDYVVRTVGDCDPTRNRTFRLASLGAEAWDLLSDSSLRWLTEQIPPSIGEGSPAPESRLIWAGYAIRLPGEWYKRYQGLDPVIQSALLDSLNPVALRHFDREMKATMYAALGDDESVLADGGRLLPFAAALAPKKDDRRLQRLLEDGGPIFARVLSQLKKERPSIVSSATEARVLNRLRDALAEQSEGARKGTVSLGGPGPRVELGRMLAVAKEPSRELIELLVETAVDPTLPPQYLTEARQGLVLLRRSGRLRASDLRRLRSAPEPPGQSPFEEGLTQGVLRVLLLQILADRPTASERGELVSAVRSNEVRIRDIAVNACAEALQVSRDEGLAWAVVSGLFDPSDSVSDGALAGLGPLTEHFKAAAEVAWQRLPDLFDSSARNVRSQVILALAHAPARTRQQRARRAALLARARRDRSWLVRDAATEVTSGK